MQTAKKDNGLLSENPSKWTTDNCAVIIVTFRRPSHTRKCLSAASFLFSKYPVFIFQDGLNPGCNDDDLRANWYLTQSIILDYQSQFPNIKYLNLGTSHGCRYSVQFAARSVLCFYKQILVLEDDIVLAAVDLSLIDFLFKRLEESNAVSLYLGGNMSIPHRTSDVSQYLCEISSVRIPHIWGWLVKRSLFTDYKPNRESWLACEFASFLSNVFADPQQYTRLILHNIVNLPKVYGSYKFSTWDFQLCHTSLCHGLEHLVLDPPIVENIGFDILATHTHRQPEESRNLNLVVICNTLNYLGGYYLRKILLENSFTYSLCYSLRVLKDDFHNEFCRLTRSYRNVYNSFPEENFSGPLTVCPTCGAQQNAKLSRLPDLLSFVDLYGLGDVVQDYVFLASLAKIYPSTLFILYVRPEVYEVADIWFCALSNLHVRPKAPHVFQKNIINLWKNSRLSWSRTDIPYFGHHVSHRSYTNFYRYFYSSILQDLGLFPYENFSSLPSRQQLVYSNTLRNHHDALTQLSTHKFDIFFLNHRPLSGQIDSSVAPQLELLAICLSKLRPQLNIGFSTSYIDDVSGINKYDIETVVSYATNSTFLVSIASGPFFLSITKYIEEIFALCAEEDVDLMPNMRCFSSYADFLAVFKNSLSNKFHLEYECPN